MKRILVLLLAAAVTLASCGKTPSRSMPIGQGTFEDPSADNETPEATSPVNESSEIKSTEESSTTAPSSSEEDTTESQTEPDTEATSTEVIIDPDETPDDSDQGAWFTCEKGQAYCPEGWSNFPVKDFWDDSKKDEKTLQFYKGTIENDWDTWYLASVRMVIYDADANLLDTRGWYEDTEDVSMIDMFGRIWEGYTGMYGGEPNFFISTSNENHIYTASGLLSSNKSSYELTDDDFLMIISSLIGSDEIIIDEPETTEPEEETTTEEPTTEEETTTEEPTTEEVTTTEEPTTEEETTTEEPTTEEPSEVMPRVFFDPARDVEITYRDGVMTAVFETLPETLEDVAACVEEYGLGELNMAIWFVTAMYRYQESPLDATQIMTALADPDSAAFLVSFVTDQLKEKPYLSNAYFKGAVKENSYTPDKPLTVSVMYTEGTDSRYTYVRVMTDADQRERTIAFMNDGRVEPGIAACPSLVLGIY